MKYLRHFFIIYYSVNIWYTFILNFVFVVGNSVAVSRSLQKIFDTNIFHFVAFQKIVFIKMPILIKV